MALGALASNPALDLYGIFRHVPVVRLIVDEASQIDTFEFMVSTLLPSSCSTRVSESLYIAPVRKVHPLGESLYVR